MKILKTVVLVILITSYLTTQGNNKASISTANNLLKTTDDSLGLAGDNLDLSSVLDIFKKSKTVEDFEKKLNAADTKVNNLDLNHDGKVDYIRVIESGSDSSRNLILQVPISKSESQDVAVIQLQKNGDKTVHIQIVGDESLYGKDYIIEPKNQASSSSTESSGSTNTNTTSNPDNSVTNNYYGTQQPNSYINVWGWPSVSFMYGSGYSYWVSPWYYGYYPMGWNSWSPYGGYAYHQRMMGFGYYGYYHRANYNRMGGGYSRYYGGRVSSAYVQRTRNREGSNYGHRMGEGRQSDGNHSSHNVQQRPENGNRQNAGNNQKSDNVRRQPQGGNEQHGGNNQKSNNGQQHSQGGNGQNGGNNQKSNSGQQHSQNGSNQNGGNRQNGGGNNMPNGNNGGGNRGNNNGNNGGGHMNGGGGHMGGGGGGQMGGGGGHR